MAASQARSATTPAARGLSAAPVAGRDNGTCYIVAVAAGLAVLAVGGGLLWRRWHNAAARDGGSPAPAWQAGPPRQPRTGEQPATVIAARRLSRAAGVLAFSALADSGLEHYRGSFANPAMIAPPLISAATLAVSAHGTADAQAITHRVRHGTSVAAAATGFAGLGFHLYNITKRPGGLSWLNLFYGAPPAAPAAVALAGLLGYGRPAAAR